MRSWLLLSLVSSVALASAGPKTHRVSALLIPMDQGAEGKSLRLESYMNDALSEVSTVILKKTDDLFGVPPDEEGEAALRRAEEGYTQARLAFESTQYDDAEKKLRAALHEYTKAASALRDTTHYCDALAMYAAVTYQRGDSEESKNILLDLLSLNPTFELPPKRYSRDFISLRAQVATSRNAAMRGNLNVKTKPAGARIYLDGEFKDYAPNNLQTLPAGKHLLRIEKPGFKQYGEFVEITPEDQEVNAELRPTSGYRAYDALLDRVATEVVKDRGATSIASLGKALGLERALVGVVKEVNENGTTEVLIGFYDMANGGKKLAGKRIVFQGEEFGQLKSEVTRVVNYLLNSAEGGEKVVKSSDPLDVHHGMEEWNGDERAHPERGTKRARYHDPLDQVNGTEDW